MFKSNLKSIFSLSFYILFISFAVAKPISANESQVSQTASSDDPAISAAIIESSFQNNGENSESISTAENNISDNTNSSNSVSIANNIEIYANSGKNTAEENQGSVQISTGDTINNVTIINIANQNNIGNFCCGTSEETEKSIVVSPNLNNNNHKKSSSSVDGLVLSSPNSSQRRVKQTSSENSMVLSNKVKKVSAFLPINQNADGGNNNLVYVISLNLITVGFILMKEYLNFLHSDLLIGQSSI